MTDTPPPTSTSTTSSLPVPMPAASPPAPAADPAPKVEHHAETGTDLVTYTGDGLTGPAVTIRALTDGYQPIAAPDQLAPDTWRVQVLTKE